MRSENQHSSVQTWSRNSRFACTAVFFLFIFGIIELFVLKSPSENITFQNQLRKKFALATNKSFFKSNYEKHAKGTKTYLGYNRSSPTFNSSQFHNDMSLVDESLLRELVFRRNTRYWYESKPKWPLENFPIMDKFVTFSPWNGGFNNIRMSYEMALAFAILSNRTLVLPKFNRIYLRGKGSMDFYFDFDDLARGASIISYQDFVNLDPFKKYTKNENCEGENCYVWINSLPNGTVYSFSNRQKNSFAGHIVYCFPDCPTDGLNDANSRKEYTWFKNFVNNRKSLSANAPEISDAKIVHFSNRLLGQFYAFVYARDPQKSRAVKRIIRDHLHFREEIVQYSERIIEKLRDFQYSCVHIRRNDFQFEEALTTAEQIVENIGPLFKANEMIYIASDELSSGSKQDSYYFSLNEFVSKINTDHSWFNPMREKWGAENIAFLSNFIGNALDRNVPKAYLGCIESLVCARARVFVGTRKSTFSGYINRLRGYMNDVGQKMVFEAQSQFPYDYYAYKKGPQWFTLTNAYGGGHPYWGLEYSDSWDGVYEF